MSSATVMKWFAIRRSLQGCLGQLTEPAAGTNVTPEALRQMGAELKCAAEWACTAVKSGEDEAVSAALAEYRDLLRSLQTALTQFEMQQRQRQEQLRSEHGHLNAAQAWMHRSRQISL